MRIMKGNIWDYWKKNCCIIIPTNGNIKKNGSCIMGKGLAYQAKSYLHNIEYILGKLIKQRGNNVFIICREIITFPVKNNWWEKADINLIKKSTIQLKSIIDFNQQLVPILLPKVGCGNGKLNWKDVEPILNKYLDERFIIMDLK